MKINITPTYFGVNAVDSEDAIDAALSGILMKSVQIDVSQIRRAYKLQPILQVSLVPAREETDVLFAAAKFAISKDGAVIQSAPTAARKMSPSMLFKADDSQLVDLTPYRVRNRMVGNWRIEAGIFIFRQKIIAQSDEQTLRDFLASARYQGVGAFEWEVIRPVEASELNPDGTVRDSVRVSTQNNTTVSMNSI